MPDLLAIGHQLSIWLVPVLLAITIHEAAHGWAAEKLGDDTARRLGRVTANPIKHVDPFGTIALPGLLLLLQAPFLFGWAKPVPVNFGRLRNPKADMLWVAAAGPFVNLLMAVGWAILFTIAARSEPGAYSVPMLKMADAGIQINAVLMVLNLLPIPPLDGGRIAVSLLPDRLAWQFARLEPFGFPILLVLLFTGILGEILWPLIVGFRFLLSTVFGF